MRFLHDKPIKRKLNLIILVTAAAVPALSLGFALAAQVGAVGDGKTADIEFLAKTHGASSRATAASQDRCAADELLTALSSHDKVVERVSLLFRARMPGFSSIR